MILMTERFELIWETDEMCNVFDNDLDVNSTLSVEEVVDLLNKYSKENEQLKRQVDELDGLLNAYQITFEELEEILEKRRWE